MQSTQFEIFTDGACLGNPGPGGWACVVRDLVAGSELEVAGGACQTTNNRMELQAVIAALERLPQQAQSATIVTDSVYVAKGCQDWIKSWKANGWRRREGNRWKPVKNEDLWRRLDALLALYHITFSVVRGHSGHPENERCDRLASQQAKLHRQLSVG